MNTPAFPFAAVVLALAAMAATPARAGTPLDAATMKSYGGTYLSDCDNPASPKVTVFPDALVVLQGNRRIAGSKVQAAPSYFGQSPPPAYQVALLSEVAGGKQMLAIVYRDASGQYLTLDGDPAVRTNLGPVMLGHKFRLCDAPPQRAVAAPRKYAPTEVSAPGLLEDARFKSAYHRALGAKRGLPWLAKLDGPSPINKKHTVGGTEYILASACKNHDCANHNAVLLYAVAQGSVVGRIYERGRVTFIGGPSETLRAELDRLWLAEWRQGR